MGMQQGERQEGGKCRGHRKVKMEIVNIPAELRHNVI